MGDSYHKAKTLVLAIGIAVVLGLTMTSASAEYLYLGENFCALDSIFGRVAAWYYGVKYEGGALCG